MAKTKKKKSKMTDFRKFQLLIHCLEMQISQMKLIYNEGKNPQTAYYKDYLNELTELYKEMTK